MAGVGGFSAPIASLSLHPSWREAGWNWVAGNCFTYLLIGSPRAPERPGAHQPGRNSIWLLWPWLLVVFCGDLFILFINPVVWGLGSVGTLHPAAAKTPPTPCFCWKSRPQPGLGDGRMGRCVAREGAA